MKHLLAACVATVAVCQSPIATLDGSASGDRFGNSVGGAGDVDGDGVPDLIAGAPFEGGAGAAHVLSGADHSVIWRLPGDDPGDRFGQAVAGAGDVDRDGFADLIVGAPHDGAGSARVVSGRTGVTLYTFRGQSSGDEFGFAVSTAGDIDRDGFDDVIVGAHLADGTGDDAGSATVYSGRTGDVLYHFDGERWGDHFGTSVAAAGDVNADGWPDLLIGAPWDDNFASKSGAAFVLSGRDGSQLRVFDGHGLGHEFGWAVSHIGDLDGDGHAEVFVASPEDKRFGDDAGSVWVYSGKDGSLVYSLFGSGAFEYFGISIAAGDVDMDGVADLIVGAPRLDAGAPDGGAVHVYSGASGALLFTQLGIGHSDLLGYSVGVAGDLDCDGAVDVIAGIPFADSNGSDSGALRLYRGMPGSSMTTFGTGCPAAQPLMLSYGGAANAGETVEIRVANAPGATSVLFGWKRIAPLDLGSLGMPGCRLYQDLFAAVGTSGTLRVAIPPSLPCGLALFNQAIALAPANALGVITSNGGRLAVPR